MGKNKVVQEGEFLWRPSADLIRSGNLTHFRNWLADRGHQFADYEALWLWSVDDIDAFWAAIWDYCDIQSDAPYERIRSGVDMMHTRWFPGSRVNYAEHLLRYECTAADDEVALLHSSETGRNGAITWKDLGNSVRLLATNLRSLGVGRGDRVVSYMPNLPETVIAMMATTAIGAVWSSAAPEFGIKTVVDRFAQIEPKLIFVADGYVFGGKRFDRLKECKAIIDALPSLSHVVWLPCLSPERRDLPQGTNNHLWDSLLGGVAPGRKDFRFERVENEHPLWVLFSSGTTGLPKAIVHSHVGMLVEHLKFQKLHIDLKPRDVMFFYSTTGWMMWNLIISSLLVGAVPVLYDGNPAYPDAGALWRIAERSRATVFGASPTLVKIMQQTGFVPRQHCRFDHLRMILLSGSPSAPETFSWLYENVREDLWVTSQSGGTELCSALIGSVPDLPVYAGEMQGRGLGMDVDCWSEEGQSLRNETGELVVKQPFPSMPIYFWKDDNGSIYRQSYFETFPGVWRHGDLFKLNDRGGSYIYGRADATLNRYGVRIGSSEIYRTMEQIESIEDSLIVCIERPDGSFFMPLFVKLRSGYEMNATVQRRINETLREDNSPRHVPDVIVEAPGIPYTLTGKRMEIPVRKLLAGMPAERAASKDVMAQPELLDWYAEFAGQEQARRPALPV